jgi:predicted transcriptional regulator
VGDRRAAATAVVDGARADLDARTARRISAIVQGLATAADGRFRPTNNGSHSARK